MVDYSGCCVGIFILFIILIVLYFLFKDAFSSNTKPPLQQYESPSYNTSLPQPTIPQQPSAQPQVIKEREIIKEVIKIKCPYCGALVDQGVDRCPNCGAPLR